jgi:hypothetical protein
VRGLVKRKTKKDKCGQPNMKYRWYWRVVLLFLARFKVFFSFPCLFLLHIPDFKIKFIKIDLDV